MPLPSSQMPGIYVSFVKPIVDRIAAAMGIILLSPLFLATAFAFLITRHFPMIFKQLRTGKDGQPFTLYKFRTLATDDSLPLPERKFWMGSFLRTTSLDELPQLWNVLTGDMSVVGPRPLPLEYLPLYSEEQRRRHTMKPGITGWAQVNGRHGISWQKKFELDVEYVNNQSFILDLRILLKTIVLLLSFRKDISLTEQPFRGNPNT